MKLEISAIGVCSPFGEAWPGFQAGVLNTKNCLVEHQPLQNLPFSQAGLTEKKSFRRYLQQRKAAKLFTPSAKLGLLACGRALDKHPMVNSQEAGLFVAVGREPPDEGEAERTLVVSHQAGELNTEKLSTVGRDLYPPLLPLKRYSSLDVSLSSTTALSL